MGRLKNGLSMRFLMELDLETFALATLEDKENSTSIEMLLELEMGLEPTTCVVVCCAHWERSSVTAPVSLRNSSFPHYAGALWGPLLQINNSTGLSPPTCMQIGSTLRYSLFAWS